MGLAHSLMKHKNLTLQSDMTFREMIVSYKQDIAYYEKLNEFRNDFYINCNADRGGQPGAIVSTVGLRGQDGEYVIEWPTIQHVIQDYTKHETAKRRVDLLKGCIKYRKTGTG